MGACWRFTFYFILSLDVQIFSLPFEFPPSCLPFEAILPFQHWVDEEQERHESLKRKLVASSKIRDRGRLLSSPPPCSFSALITAWRGTTCTLQAFLLPLLWVRLQNWFSAMKIESLFMLQPSPTPEFHCGKKLSLLFWRFLSTRQLEYNQKPPNTVCHLVLI